VIADNHSSDDSLATLRRIIASDPEVIGITNAANYRPEASVVNALRHARDCDLVMLLCSDLQDPPEIASQRDGMHAAGAAGVGCGAGGEEALGLRPAVAADAKDRLRGSGPVVAKTAGASGFHGFGCYRQAVLEEATRFWNNTDLNVRQCLTNACHSPQLIDYVQPERLRGVSSYRGWGYLPEALRSLVSGNAAASRLALTIGITGLGLVLGCWWACCCW
jgi:glycosyltransferase involved in cell wall biosynthesis